MSLAGACSSGPGEDLFALLAASTVVNFIGRQTLSALAPILKSEYSWTNSDFASLLIVFRLAYTIMQGVGGRFLDEVGSRLGFALVVAFYSLVAMATSFAQGLASFRIFRFLLGLGEGPNFPGAAKTVAEWFPNRERAWAVALFDSGTSIGGAIAPRRGHHQRPGGRRSRPRHHDFHLPDSRLLNPESCFSPLTTLSPSVTYRNTMTLNITQDPPLFFGDLEHLLMEVIWSQGPSTAAGCRAALLPTHPVNGGTVSTVLRHLEQKGLLKHRVGVDERTYIYEATHPRRHFAARAVQNIIDRFCGGSVEQLLVGLVENKVLKQKDLDHLARYSASQRAEKK